jgi:hypothetical protein
MPWARAGARAPLEQVRVWFDGGAEVLEALAHHAARIPRRHGDVRREMRSRSWVLASAFSPCAFHKSRWIPHPEGLSRAGRGPVCWPSRSASVRNRLALFKVWPRPLVRSLASCPPAIFPRLWSGVIVNASTGRLTARTGDAPSFRDSGQSCRAPLRRFRASLRPRPSRLGRFPHFRVAHLHNTTSRRSATLRRSRQHLRNVASRRETPTSSYAEAVLARNRRQVRRHERWAGAL